ncbi:MAG: small conductance mechanosensitive channel [Verrucomicrobiales bacterium]
MLAANPSGAGNLLCRRGRAPFADMNIDWQELLEKWGGMAMDYAPKLALAIVVFFVGLRIIAVVNRAISKVIDTRDLDPTLKPFFKSISSILLKALLFITVLGMLGVQMTSFIALLGAGGIAIGMALSGTLQNVAGGVVLLTLRPFRVGDFVETQGYSGTVKSIGIFHTTLTTGDNKTVILPNAPVSNDPLVNFTTQDRRRVELTIGIGYDDDIDKARDIMRKLIEADERVLKDPQPVIAVSALADSSVNFVVRAWTATSDYWEVNWHLHEAIKKAFDAEGVSIPFPQTDVHVHQVVESETKA